MTCGEFYIMWVILFFKHSIFTGEAATPPPHQLPSDLAKTPSPGFYSQTDLRVVWFHHSDALSLSFLICETGVLHRCHKTCWEHLQENVYKAPPMIPVA